MNLKKEVALEVPFDQIRGVEIHEDMLNYRIELDTDGGQICLSTQQKELSEFRSSGTLAAGVSGLGTNRSGGKILKPVNWHCVNLDATLEELRKLNH